MGVGFVGVRDFFWFGWERKTDFSMRGAYTDPRLGLCRGYEDDEGGNYGRRGSFERTLGTMW